MSETGFDKKTLHTKGKEVGDIFPESKGKSVLKKVDTNPLVVTIETKKSEKTFKQVRIETGIIDDLREYCYQNRIPSYAKMANVIIRNFLDNGGEVEILNKE